MKAQCRIGDGPNYQRSAFITGLRAAGYTVEARISNPQPGDVLLIWNRRSNDDLEAKRFEKAGARVLVTENGYLGKHWQGKKWFSLAIGHHAGAGIWPDLGPSRWASIGEELHEWRAPGHETIILAQRGIGESGIASPRGWAQAVQAKMGGRIRAHPGINEPVVPLAEDLRDALAVVTWHSAAAIQALMLGVPVQYAFPQWIMAPAAAPLDESVIRYPDRLPAFERLAWAMWHADEIRSGEPFERIRQCAS